MRVVIEMDGNARGYGVIHREGCRDVRDPEPLGEVATGYGAQVAASNEVWPELEPEDYRLAPCVRKAEGR